MSRIHETIDSNAEIIFGTTSDNTLETDEVKITIVATGFESKNDTTFESKPTEEENSKKVSPSDENYLDIPPLMRDYKVQYQLA